MASRRGNIKWRLRTFQLYQSHEFCLNSWGCCLLFNASLYKDSELCFKIYVVCFRTELKEFWEKQPSVTYCNDLLEGGEDADLGGRQRKSGLCKWPTAVKKCQQKRAKADVYLRAVKRGHIWWWEEWLQTHCAQESRSSPCPGRPRGKWQN